MYHTTVLKDSMYQFVPTKETEALGAARVADVFSL